MQIIGDAGDRSMGHQLGSMVYPQESREWKTLGWVDRERRGLLNDQGLSGIETGTMAGCPSRLCQWEAVVGEQKATRGAEGFHPDSCYS